MKYEENSGTPPESTTTILAVADTHVAIWYLNNPDRLSRRALSFLDTAATVPGAKIALSAITLVELIYLIDKDQFPRSHLTELNAHLADNNGLFVLVDLDSVKANAVARVPRDEVPNMPDRIISATALSLGVPLITADDWIIKSSVTTIW